jgi:hypothetical protein
MTCVTQQYDTHAAQINAYQMPSVVLWDVTQRSLVGGYKRFGGTYRLHIQGRNLKLFSKLKTKHSE